MSEWTVDTLHAHMDQRFADSGKAVDAALAAQKEATASALTAAQTAVSKAEDAANKRFDGVNEFRAQLADQARAFMPRAESEAEVKNLRERLDVLTSRMERGDGQSTGQAAVVAYVIAGVGLLTGVVGAVVAILH